MKSKVFFLTGGLLVMLLSASLFSVAQDATKAKTPVKEISSKDKTTIIDIFKNLSPWLYYLEFNEGKEYYRTILSYSPAELLKFRQGINPITDPNSASQTFFRSYPSIKLWFVIYGVGAKSRDLEYFFGKTPAQRLKAIIAKYADGKEN